MHLTLFDAKGTSKQADRKLVANVLRRHASTGVGRFLSCKGRTGCSHNRYCRKYAIGQCLRSQGSRIQGCYLLLLSLRLRMSQSQ